jgi:hypothetical protein
MRNTTRNPKRTFAALLFMGVALAVLVALVAPGAAFAATFTNVALVDANCSNKTKADPDSHTRACALKCASSGYGVWTADGKYLKFDAAGSEKAKALLEASDKKDKLRVDIEGTVEGETLTVTSIAWAT